MEIICRIVEQGALTQRAYTDRQGQQQTFTSMPFVLASGQDTLFAELTGEAATKQAACSKDYYYKADLSLRADRYTTQQGEERQSTRIYINRIAPL